MDTSKLKTEHLILIIILMMALINGLTSCSTRQITHTPTKREINRAMKYSTSEYRMNTKSIIHVCCWAQH